MNSYGRKQKERLEEISKKFQGLKGEYEHLHLKMQSTLKWRFRVKWLEKVCWVIILVFGFLVYKSPSLLSYVMADHPIFTISLVSLLVIGFSLASWYLEKKTHKTETLVKKLKEKMRDAKRLLISQMDPIMVEAVKDIVRADMKEELERLRNSDEGCSEKCNLSQQMLKLDISRNELLVHELIQFKWCDQCKQG